MGELNGTSEDPGPRESVFYIDDSGDGELLILGLDHQAKLSARGSGKRVITITGGARVRLENITLSGGRAENGGGVFVEDAALTLGDGVLVTGNRAVLDGGGIVVYSGSLTLSGAEIGKNHAGDDGGGVYTRRGNFTLRGNSRIVDNLADCGGGVCVDDGSSFVMEGRVLVGGNKAAGRQGTGGGLCVGMDSEMVMRDGLVIDNKAKRGAGVYNALGRFVLEGGSVSGNVARERGGGICVEQGGLILKAGAVSVNRAASAGGVYAMGEYRRSGGVEMNGNIPEDEGGPDAGD
jgi:hypothetical protein